jgi:hypothetical protein
MISNISCRMHWKFHKRKLYRTKIHKKIHENFSNTLDILLENILDI